MTVPAAFAEAAPVADPKMPVAADVPLNAK